MDNELKDLLDYFRLSKYRDESDYFLLEEYNELEDIIKRSSMARELENARNLWITKKITDEEYNIIYSKYSSYLDDSLSINKELKKK